MHPKILENQADDYAVLTWEAADPSIPRDEAVQDLTVFSIHNLLGVTITIVVIHVLARFSASCSAIR